MKISIGSTSKIVKGHVLDVAQPPLLAALRRYDPQLYLKWNPKKRSGLGLWELRRRPELKSAKAGRILETPKGHVLFPGDIYEFDDFTLAVPKYHETTADCVKTFEQLDYRILDWVAKNDLWRFGFKGKKFADEADYLAAKYEEKIDDEADAERQYMIRDMRTQVSDFREYVLSGGDPYRLLDYWK